MTDIRFSCGTNSFDRQPVTVSTTWNDFVPWLRDQRIERPATIAHKERQTPFIAPFILYPDATGKLISNIDSFGAWFGLDVDYGWTLWTLMARFDGARRLCYTTTQSRPDMPRLRLLVALSREYGVPEYRRLWLAFNGLLDGAIDHSTKNPNRLLYAPAFWHGADNGFVTSDGDPLDVDAMIATVAEIEAEPPPNTDHLPGATLPACELVTKGMVRRYLSAAEGGRFYHLLIEIAARCRVNGWSVSANEIEAAARAVDEQITRKKRRGTLHEAQRALGWAMSNVTPLTAIERVRRRLSYIEARRQHHR